MDKEVEDTNLAITFSGALFFSVYLIGIICVVTITLSAYFGSLDLIWRKWTGQSNSFLDDGYSHFFAITLALTLFSIVFILWRYKPYFKRFIERFFLDDNPNKIDHAKYRNPIVMLLLVFVLLTISMLILVSIMAFTIGTAFSLGIFDESKLNNSGQFTILPFFVLGVTIVTLAVSEAIKWIDQFLIPDDDLSKDENLKIIFNEVLTQYLGREEE